jgi:hypothetical protein
MIGLTHSIFESYGIWLDKRRKPLVSLVTNMNIDFFVGFAMQFAYTLL